MHPAELDPDKSLCPVCGTPGLAAPDLNQEEDLQWSTPRTACDHCLARFVWGPVGWMYQFDSMHIANLIEHLRSDAPPKGSPLLAVDFASCEFLESASLCRLIEIDGELKAQGRRLVIYNLREEVREVLMITKLDRIFDIQ